MKSMQSLSPSDSAVIGTVFHGHTAEIDRDGFDPNWLESFEAREVLHAALVLSRQGKPVNLLNVMAVANKVDRAAWPIIIEIGKNGYGDVSWRDAVKSARNSYFDRETKRIYAEMGANLNDKNKRNCIQDWLPALNYKLSTMFDSGRPKDSTPSQLLEEEVPTIKFQSLIPGMNELWGGGYRSWMLAIYAGCPGHGKSTSLISHAVDAITQGKQVSFIVNELMPAVITRRILRGLSGLTEQEIEKKQGNTPEREELRKQWIVWMDNYLRVYDSEMYRPSWMRRIIAWDKPDLLIVDYLRDYNGMLDGKMSSKDPVGDMAYEMLDIYRSEKVCIITAGQMSDKNSQDFQKNDHAKPAIIYGSARCIQAAGLYIGTKRDNQLAEVQYYRKWKDSFTGHMDVEARVRFNPLTHVYQIVRPAA